MINQYEQEILECVAGEREWPKWGAWVGACLSSLWEQGLITSECDPSLTEKGKAVLAERGP